MNRGDVVVEADIPSFEDAHWVILNPQAATAFVGITDVIDSHKMLYLLDVDDRSTCRNTTL